MISRGVTRQELASLTGLSPKTVSNIISGTNHTRSGRLAIEVALGRPFWHEAADFANVKKAIEEKGVAVVLSRPTNYRKFEEIRRLESK